jgi:DegV family protein with EDD domain
MVKIVTDSAANVPPRMAEELSIEVVPYYIHMDGTTFRDMVDVLPEKFCKELTTAKTIPKTATPGPGDYIKAFRSLADRFSEIVTIHMTSKGSGAYQAALVAKEMFSSERPGVRIEVVDTLQVAMSHGWAVIEAARAAMEGASIEKVAQTAQDVAAKGFMLQTADTLKYLYMGGRIGRATQLLGSMLDIKPIIGMEDGVISGVARARGRKQAYRRIVKIMEEKLGSTRRIKVGFTHCDAYDELMKLRALVCGRFECVEEIVTYLPPSLGVHSGPGTVGVSFYPVEG